MSLHMTAYRKYVHEKVTSKKEGDIRNIAECLLLLLKAYTVRHSKTLPL